MSHLSLKSAVLPDGVPVVCKRLLFRRRLVDLHLVQRTAEMWYTTVDTCNVKFRLQTFPRVRVLKLYYSQWEKYLLGGLIGEKGKRKGKEGGKKGKGGGKKGEGKGEGIRCFKIGRAT